MKEMDSDKPLPDLTDKPAKAAAIGSEQQTPPSSSETSSGSGLKNEAPVIGFYEWFRPGEHGRVERVLADLKLLGVATLRTGVSWADWYEPGGPEWYSWLLPRLAREVEVLPCFIYTPPTLAVAPRISAPPRDPKWYADFIDQMITLFGDHFDWVELWSGPNNLREWDVSLDPDWMVFSQMVGGAAYWARHRGKKTVLGSTGPIDLSWVRLMCERRVMRYINAVGLQGAPPGSGCPGSGCEDWDESVARIREVLDRHGSEAEVWITGAGYSTWRHDERQQLAAFVKAVEAPVERVYWHRVHDLDPAMDSADDPRHDERDCHLGLKRADGSPKLLYRLWESGGLGAVRDTAWWGARSARRGSRKRPTLITGGAGFVGANLAHRLLSEGRPVLLFDNLSRKGVEQNLQWLRDTHGDLAQIEIADVRNAQALARAVKRASQVFHFAAQVAVTTSLSDPLGDFEINARGAFNLLEALRALNDPPPLVFTSTNKVYGALEDVKLVRCGARYEPLDEEIRQRGLGENRPLDFHSPYGCSKGAADQYVADYARSFDLPAVIFRMSCIYGPRQFGTEDQGWVAHFLIRAIEGEPLNIYGDGRQVRDALFVEDLVSAFLLAQKNIEAIAGEVFNIGGGPANTISLLELISLIGEIEGEMPEVLFDQWRPGDQRYYVSDMRKFQRATGWRPKVTVFDGVRRLREWLLEARGARPTRAAARHMIR
ncbi:MAG: NAD-dependent epimerase/dehydratase family protein [Blastocatellales bacterium]